MRALHVQCPVCAAGVGQLCLKNSRFTNDGTSATTSGTHERRRTPHKERRALMNPLLNRPAQPGPVIDLMHALKTSLKGQP